MKVIKIKYLAFNVINIQRLNLLGKCVTVRGKENVCGVGAGIAFRKRHIC